VLAYSSITLSGKVSDVRAMVQHLETPAGFTLVISRWCLPWVFWQAGHRAALIAALNVLRRSIDTAVEIELQRDRGIALGVLRGSIFREPGDICWNCCSSGGRKRVAGQWSRPLAPGAVSRLTSSDRKIHLGQAWRAAGAG